MALRLVRSVMVVSSSHRVAVSGIVAWDRGAGEQATGILGIDGLDGHVGASSFAVFAQSPSRDFMWDCIIF